MQRRCRPRRHRFAATVVAGVIVASCLATGGARGALPRSGPGAQGVAAAGLAAAVDALDRHGGLHSVMILRHGHVVAEGWWRPYDPATPHMLFSLSKSFTATAMGLAVAEGKLSVADRVLPFFPDDAPAEPAANLKAMRVADLLRMSTGQQSEPPRPPEGGWVKAFLGHPVPFKPGTHFLYNTPATFMQSAIVQRATGENLLAYLTPRLFAPLGIEGATWESSPEGIAMGGFGLSLKTEDIATFGQLLLQRGRWGDRQLVPEEWIAAATARQTANGSNPDSDWDQGYGYQFWRCRHGAFRGDGAFGQFCVVLPAEDTVVAITAGTKDMQGILDILWRDLLPALGDTPVADDPAAIARLRARLAGLTIPPPAPGTPVPAHVGRTFSFAANPRAIDAVTVECDEVVGCDVLCLRVGGREERIACGRGRWQPGEAAIGPLPRQPIAAAGGWEGDTFTARICFPRTPFVVTLPVAFTPDTATLGSETNVGFGKTAEEPIVGRPAAAR